MKLISLGLCTLILLGILLLSIQRWRLLRDRQSYLEIPLCKNCNVVLIDIDTLRADALPCYGYRRNTAPNLCALSEKSSTFERNFSHSWWTLPSLASTVTSLYPSTHKVFNSFTDAISPEIDTMAELFKRQGYKTVFVANHFVQRGWYYLPLGFDRGFEQKVEIYENGWPRAVSDLLSSEKPFFVHFYSAALHLPYLLHEGMVPIENMEKPEGFPDTKAKYDELLADYLVEHYEEMFTRETIRQYPDLFDNVPMNKRELLEAFYLPERTKWLKDSWTHRYKVYMSNVLKGGPAGLEYMRLMYDTQIFYVDRLLGELLDVLQNSDIANKTILVVMSEHGEEFGEHGGFSHPKSLYNEVLHTPLVILVPGVRPQRIPSITQNIDLLPTLMELTGIPIPNRLQGSSLVSQIVSGGGATQYSVSEMDERSAAIQDIRWKLIAFDYLSPSPKIEFYDLLNDRKEKNNSVKQNESRAKELLSELRFVLLESKRAYQITPSPFPAWIDEEKRKKLIQEGYF